MRLIAMYGLFCLVATGANLGMQWLVKTLAIRSMVGVETLPFLFALASGTAVGLVVKYVLDKRWIFHDLSSGAKLHAKKLSLYTLMGLVTTAIFWACETAAYLIAPGGNAMLGGGAVGLTIGYVVKYHLDKRFVFMAPAL